MHMISLPLEILEEIASLIEHHNNLVSLALTCMVWKRLLIPAHTEYRIIRVRGRMFSMWAHLARRSDLARNIREIHLCEPDNFLSPDHYPTMLLDAGQLECTVSKEDQRIGNMCQALKHMKYLEEFEWSWNGPKIGHPTHKAVHEAQIFNALSHCKSLKRLRLSGPFGEHALGIDRDPEGVFYPLWNVANLEALALEGKAWVRPQLAPHVRSMLSRSPNLHTLLFPLEFPFLSTASPSVNLTSPIFPHLHTLKLTLQSGALPSIDARIASFLSLHPTITDLEWFPLSGPIDLPPGTLPQLRRLVTYTSFGFGLRGLLGLTGGGLGCGPLDCLSEISVCKNELDAALFPVGGSSPSDNPDDENANINVPSSKIPIPEVNLHLKKLKIHNYDCIESIVRLGALFPQLDWLSIEPPDREPPNLEAWLTLLASFPMLTTFLGGALFDTVYIQHPEINDRNLTYAEIDSVIQRIAHAAPRLMEVDYWEQEENKLEPKARAWKYWRILILRDREQKPVTWERRTVNAGTWFDPLTQYFQ